MNWRPRNKDLGWTVYVWLMYLPIFVVEPIARTRAVAVPVWLWPATILGLIAFLVSYYLGFWGARRRLPFVALFQAGLGVAFAPINSGAAVFFVYAASFAGQLDDGARALRFILLIAALGGLTALAIGSPLYFGIPAVGLSLLIGGVNLHSTQSSRAQQKLRLAQDEVEHLAAVAERERIARDLHDVLGHTLSLIILKSELASKLADRDPARAAHEIRDVEAVARKALQEVREAIRGYRATLADEVERASSLLKAADIAADISVAELELSRAQAETLALALREAVTNVVRHARAQHCSVAIRQEESQAVLEVFDDGRGSSAAEGTGLRGMRERIEVLGGSIERTNSHGVRLVVRLPLHASPARSDSFVGTMNDEDVA